MGDIQSRSSEGTGDEIMSVQSSSLILLVALEGFFTRMDDPINQTKFSRRCLAEFWLGRVRICSLKPAQENFGKSAHTSLMAACYGQRREWGTPSPPPHS